MSPVECIGYMSPIRSTSRALHVAYMFHRAGDILQGVHTADTCCFVNFWLFLTNGTLYQSSKTLKTIGVQMVTGLTRLYKQCTNGVPIVKNSQKQSKHSQNTVKTVQTWPLVYQSSHVYQDCTNSVTIVYLPIVNKNLAIVNRSRVSSAHNTSRAVIGLNIAPWPWNLD